MRPEPLSGVGRLLRLFACSGEYMPGAFLCPRYVFRLAPCFYTRAVLMLGIRPDCLRSEPRL